MRLIQMAQSILRWMEKACRYEIQVASRSRSAAIRFQKVVGMRQTQTNTFLIRLSFRLQAGQLVGRQDHPDRTMATPRTPRVVEVRLLNNRRNSNLRRSRNHSLNLNRNLNRNSSRNKRDLVWLTTSSSFCSRQANLLRLRVLRACLRQ